MAEDERAGLESVKESLSFNNLADVVTGINKGLNLNNLATTLNQGTGDAGNNANSGQGNANTDTEKK